MTEEERSLFQDIPSRLIYADWLDDHGRPTDAAYYRGQFKNLTLDVDLEMIQTDYDWTEVFGQGTGGKCNQQTDDCPPGIEIDLTPPKLSDILEIIAASNGQNDEQSWVGVFRLKDGQFLLAEGSYDYTGWDCQAANELEVSHSLDDLLQFGLTNEDKIRLGFMVIATTPA